jgi:hypothetical protein
MVYKATVVSDHEYKNALLIDLEGGSVVAQAQTIWRDMVHNNTT